MRVHVDARPLRLFQKHFHIFHIVPRNQNAGIFPHTDIDRRRFGISVRARIRFIQKRHTLNAVFSRFKRKGDEIVDRKTFIERFRKRLLNKGIDFFVVLQERVRMLRIRSQSFQTVYDKFAQRANVFIARSENADRRSFRIETRNIAFPRRSFRKPLSARY